VWGVIAVMKRFFFYALVSSLLLQLFVLLIPENKVHAAKKEPDSFLFDHINKENGYEAYYRKFQNAPLPEKDILVTGVSHVSSREAVLRVLDRYEGVEHPVLEWSNDSGLVEWEVDIPETGLYNIMVRYMTMQGKSSSIERELLIDGRRPFNEVRTLLFHRVWKDKTEIRQNNRKNDIRPSQVENPIWQESILQDSDGLFKEPFKFHFTEGKHTIGFQAIREPMIVDYLRVFQNEPPRPYEEVKKEYGRKGYKEVRGQMIRFQAENTYLKSEPTLYPVYDRSNPLNEPYHPAKLRLNIIGGYNWRRNGQWISWKFSVPEDGLYKIGLKYRQNYVIGMPVTRSMEIDGRVPFQEVERMEFGYDHNWQLKVVGKDEKEPYLFYLTKGEHELRMTNNIGEISEVIRAVQQASIDLTQLYSKIIMVTGTSPDPFRDYQLDKRIDILVPTLEENAKFLRDQVEKVKRLAGSKVSEAHMLERVAVQLESLARDPETIPERLSKFRDNLSSLSTWGLLIKEQPMDIDYFVVAGRDVTLPRTNPGFVEKALHWIRSFVASFTEDYSRIGDAYGENEAISVWVMLGRDQADTLKTMIDQEFTPMTGVKVNLNIMEGVTQKENVLLMATTTREGPDVALNVSRGLPVDYGVRNALVDLSGLPGFDEISARFMPTALVPYQYEGKTYGLPQTQSFPLLFYRKDIMGALGLEVPETWEDAYRVMAALQEHNLEFGVGASINNIVSTDSFNAFLLQHGGKYYSSDSKSSALDSDEGIKAFKEWTGLYTHYGLPLYYDFFNRFRTGEMPAGIGDYTMYNLWSVAAPEIKGLWDIAPVPGTRRPDGTIDRTIGGNGTSNVIFAYTKKLETSWKFLDWWTSTETQVRYGRELEALMGPAARYNTANAEAVGYLPWPSSDYKRISEQWKHVAEIPIIPGSYYTGRHLDNAFKEVYIQGELPREAIVKYVKEINKEIRKKREEFGLK
jgi:ABC-type glycerol-3-phosphate transport system substrate-binding protein